MRAKIYFVKMVSSITTALGGMVYSFHKRIPGVKSKFNIKYVKHGNKKQKLDVFYPKTAKTKHSKNKKKQYYPAIVYFHGGGWACYDKKLYITLMRRLASFGYVVFSCNYSLAPKFKIDQIMQDARSAFDFIQNFGRNYGANTKKIVMGGDSAGAHIASELTAEFIQESNPKQKLIKALLLFYGVYNFTTVTDTHFNNIKDYVNSCFEGGIDNQPELVKYSPLFKELFNFPPCFLASGEVDKLHKTQSYKFAEALTNNNVKIEKVFFDKNEPRAFHAFMNFDSLKTTGIVLERIKTFLKDNV